MQTDSPSRRTIEERSLVRSTSKSPGEMQEGGDTTRGQRDNASNGQGRPAKKKILFFCHNHPAVIPGGAETYAFELYEAIRDQSDRYEAIFLARSGPPVSKARRPHEGTLLASVNGDKNQYFFYTDVGEFDWLYLTSRNKEIYTKFLREFLETHRPDIVHFQHTLFFGHDVIRLIKDVLPDAPIIYTLHEFLAICHRNGQLFRTNNHETCLEASPRRCHECFPDISPQTFFMRRKFIQSHLSLVDQFLAPSRFLLERYRDWGVPADKIRFEEYGRKPVQRVTPPSEDRPRNRFGFFGQFSMFKGVNVLLRAMQLLEEDEDTGESTFARRWRNPAGSGEQDHGQSVPHCWIHGANLELQPPEFRNEFQNLIEATKSHVTLVGRYQQHELPKLMSRIDWVVVPSIWWENSPLVIQEAFLHGKPVICSDIGGMAEKVTHEVDGIHFRANDPIDLARTLRHATTPGVWEHLAGGISQIYPMQEHLAAMTETYDELLQRKAIRKGVYAHGESRS